MVTMKRLLVLMAVAALTLPALTQEDKVKTGWKFGGALPAITYSTDLGFQYGVVVNLFDYGDGLRYPTTDQSIYFEVSWYTKGSSTYRLMYSTETLIPGVTLTSDLAFLTDQALDFYGYNGYDAVYNVDWTDSDLATPPYVSRMFYKTNRKLFRFKNDFKGKLAGEHFEWNAGLQIMSFNMATVDIDKLNKNKDENLLPEAELLYDKYIRWGIIDEDEADGGLITTLKGGVSYDTRDFEPNPMKGVWFETGLELSPSFLSETGFSRFYAIWRQYFTIVPQKLSFAYRLGYQTKVSGTVPFYYQNQIISSVLPGTTSEGLGGSKSVRGVLRNRIIGNGLFYGNAEFRWKAFRFQFLKQDCYLGLVGFGDFGMVTRKVDITVPDIDPDDPYYVSTNYFNPGNESLHLSAGAGLRLVMNENFIISADFGKAFDVQDGNSGFYIGLNYLF